MKALRIIGAGGHGKVVADIAEICGFEDIAFFDDAWPARMKNGNWPIIGKPRTTKDAHYFCGIGNNQQRAKLFKKFIINSSPTIVHPFSNISPYAKIGQGSLIAPGVVINVDAIIGKGVILNTGSSIDHDCIVEDFVHISPGSRLAGGVHIGDSSWIGIGAVIREGIKIGKNVVVAAGATVVSDIEDNMRVAGVPAKLF